jgi:hypothetical protein
MSELSRFTNIITNSDIDSGLTTIGFCLAMTDALKLEDCFSMRLVRSVLGVKYTHEEYENYRPMCQSTFKELIRMDLDFLTPLILTKEKNPFLEGISNFGMPDDSRVRSESNPIVYSALWKINEAMIDHQVCMNHKVDGFRKLFHDARVRLKEKNKNLVVLAVPGWSYEYCVKNPLSKSTRLKMCEEGMIYSDRVC